MPVFVGSQSFISLPSFMFVSAVVSEIRELKEKEKEKKNSEIDYFQFNTFPGHIFYPFFNQRLRSWIFIPCCTIDTHKS